MVMKKSMRFVCLPVFLSLMVTSCTVYHPQAVDIPLINHSGDTRIDASVGASMWATLDAINLNATASHGFNDWLTGQVHVNYGSDNWYGQVAPGFYYPLGANSVIELYAGYGYGGANRDSDDDKEKFSGHYHLPFGQINFGWHDLTGAHFDLGFGLKAGAFIPDYEYHKYNSDGTEDLSKYEEYKKTNMLFEPQVMFRVGSKNVKFNVKAGVAIMSDWMNDEANGMLYDVFTGSVGLTFSF